VNFSSPPLVELYPLKEEGILTEFSRIKKKKKRTGIKGQDFA